MKDRVIDFWYSNKIPWINRWIFHSFNRLMYNRHDSATITQTWFDYIYRSPSILPDNLLRSKIVRYREHVLRARVRSSHTGNLSVKRLFLLHSISLVLFNIYVVLLNIFNHLVSESLKGYFSVKEIKRKKIFVMTWINIWISSIFSETIVCLFIVIALIVFR